MAGYEFDSNTSEVTIKDEKVAEMIDPVIFCFPIQN